MTVTASTTDSAAEARDVKFVAASIVFMLMLNLPAQLYALGWRSAAFNTGFMCLVFAVYIWRFKDSSLLRWAIFGVAAGFTELLADWWLVTRTGSLVYPANEPLLVVSPIYMPFAWALLFLQLGVVGQWLRTKIPVGWAALVIGLFASINIPLYEHLAKGAGWWYYQDTPMVFSAPFYIILGEFLIGVPLVFFGSALRRRSPLSGGVMMGIVQGLVILVAYVVAWWLVGPCSGALIQFACG